MIFNFIKKLRPFDYLVIAIVIVILIVGVLTFTNKRATSSNQIEATTDIEIEIYLRGVTSTSDKPVINDNEETFVTIRNVPYTKLKVKDVTYSRRKMVVPLPNRRNNYVLVDDETSPYQFDYLIKVSDSAKITKDGDAVAGGNKVKIGMPITLEGSNYKLNGVITNIILSPEPANKVHEDLDKHTKINQDVQ